jgi:glycosyltransferase involved in cell wall biosynthesis
LKKNSLTSELFFKKQGKDILVVLPAYNEVKTIEKVMNDLLSLDLQLLVVDDGSNDDTFKIVEKLLKRNPEQISVYKHILNRGLGASLSTGIKAALLKEPRVIITFDADGQHHSQDIYSVSRPIIEGRADVVIGKRDFKEMPFFKRFGNSIMNMVTLFFYGHLVEDSQSGFRAFNRKAAELMKLHASGYGVSSEIVGEVFRHDLILEEVPITTIYTDYSQSKGTNPIIALKILAELIRDVFK